MSSGGIGRYQLYEMGEIGRFAMFHFDMYIRRVGIQDSR